MNEILTKLYKDWSGYEPDESVLLPLSGSSRKYYRLSGWGGTAVACVGTNLNENNAFINIAERFANSGLHAPKVFAISDDKMCYLQEDLGDGQLFELLKPAIETGNYDEKQMAYLHDTMALLPAVQFKVGQGLDWRICFPDKEINQRMINFDSNYFKYNFLKFTCLEFNEIRLQDDFDRLSADVLDFEGDTFMYRDFQARNIMIKDGEPCFIDFQGGRRGPIQYDLASFLWNAGTHFSPQLRKELEEVYLTSLQNFIPVDEKAFYKKYHLITLVRLLQEAGAYGFRGIVERKQLFIDCIPSVLKSLGELSSQNSKRYPYLSEVLQRLAKEWDGRTNIPGLKIELK